MSTPFPAAHNRRGFLESDMKMLRSLSDARARQVAAQAKARSIVDRQYFLQRSAERMEKAADSVECEANAPRYVPAGGAR